jgi:hypothetical protein
MIKTTKVPKDAFVAIPCIGVNLSAGTRGSPCQWQAMRLVRITRRLGVDVLLVRTIEADGWMLGAAMIGGADTPHGACLTPLCPQCADQLLVHLIGQAENPEQVAGLGKLRARVRAAIAALDADNLTPVSNTPLDTPRDDVDPAHRE